MPIELKIPEVGESITEVEIGGWLKAQGERVQKDEPVVTLESEKATVELPAPDSGTISKVLKQKGEVAKVGEVIAYLEKDGTFVNAHGRVQRIGRAFPPLPDSREDWRLLIELADRLKHPVPGRDPQEIFQALAHGVEPFAGLTYDQIGLQGSSVVSDTPLAEVAAT